MCVSGGSSVVRAATPSPHPPPPAAPAAAAAAAVVVVCLVRSSQWVALLLNRCERVPTCVRKHAERRLRATERPEQAEPTTPVSTIAMSIVVGLPGVGRVGLSVPRRVVIESHHFITHHHSPFFLLLLPTQT